MSSFGKLVSSISNNQRRERHFIFYPFSHKILSVLRILRFEGYIISFRFCLFNKTRYVEILLKNLDSTLVQNSFKLVSCCSSNLKYFSKKDLEKLSNKIGLIILSTPYGIFSDKKALLLKIGGKALFYIC
jgi:ribosomal protein S8